MFDKKLVKISLINSLLVTLYVIGVALLMTNSNSIFGQANTVITGAAVLMLFVLSAVVVSVLILGRPLMMYPDGQKKESVWLLINTIVFLLLITVLFLVYLAIFKK